MTISVTVPVQQYTGTGFDTPLATVFPFFVDTDVIVTQRITTTAVVTTMVKGVNYTITGGSAAGAAGTVTPIAGATDFTTAMTWTLERAIPLTQELDYVENDIFPAASHEAGLDRLTMQSQDRSEIVSRSMATLATDVDGSGAFSARGNRISSVATPTDGSDAATRDWTLLQIGTNGTIDVVEWPDELTSSYTTATTLTVASQPVNFLGDKVLKVGRRLLVIGSTLGSKVATITVAAEGGGTTVCTVTFDDGSTLTNEAITVYASAIAPEFTSMPSVDRLGQGFLFTEGTQGGALNGKVFVSDITPASGLHYALTSKVFTGTRTDVGSVPGVNQDVAIYCEAQRGAGSADSIWSINSITESYNLDGASIGYEIDMNNLSGLDPGLAPTHDFIGLSIVNGAADRGGTAIQTARNSGAGSNNEWNRGVWIKDVLLRGMEFTNCGNGTRIVVDNVLRIQSIDDTLSTSALSLVPSDDNTPTTDALFFTTNTAESVVTSELKKSGAWHLGGPTSALTGMMNIKQYANAGDGYTAQRFTDTTPTGWFFRAVNAAADTNLTQIGIDGRHYIAVPDSATTDGNLAVSQVSMYLDESGNALKFRVKYAGGTLKLGSIALT